MDIISDPEQAATIMSPPAPKSPEVAAFCRIS